MLPGDPACPRDPVEAATDAVDGVEGWLTIDQVAVLAELASRVPDGGLIVEIGSFRGRSTIALATAARDTARIVAIDPHAGTDRGPQEIRGKEAEAADDHDRFHRNLADAGVEARVEHVRAFSAEAGDAVDGPVDLLFVDGAHRVGPARRDLRDWGGRVRDGGDLLVHDAFSSVGVTVALGTALFGRPQWRFLGRVGSLAHYRREPQGPRELVASTVGQIASLGWFARNIAIKVTIVAGRQDWARRLGHDGSAWPY